MNMSSHIFIISLLLMLFSAGRPAAGQATSTESENTIGMLQHNVYFYLNEDVSPEERKEFEAGLKKLVSIPEIQSYQIGVPGATDERDVTDHSFGYSIFTWFESMDDYEVYDEHPVHLEFIDTYNHLWAEVKVYDSEIIDAR